ncbi:spore germination YkwD domain-containing protein [Aeoliella mucimassa]|uniref:Cysteine-rich secretory protein family protein n=1 Tax=Aeoliella mucimassa TaxID=2527972 RepID=A0A518AIY4_9BACT|nr:hypothetical protein [Aeoliella mucimassa]QDU54666.1 hypothetical protein Pan181_08490 [Aeoliella mucimassa]
MNFGYRWTAALALAGLMFGQAMAANNLNGVDLSGIELKPGERIVAIDGVPVGKLSASQRAAITQANSKAPAAPATEATPTEAAAPAESAPKKVTANKVVTPETAVEGESQEPVATNIVGNLVRSNKSFSHSDGVTALDKANTERRKQGYGALLPDPALQALALRKATIAAQRGYKNHIGGSLGGAKCEGVGWTNGRFLSCCLDEPGTYGGAAMVQGRDGWYCCLLVR